MRILLIGEYSRLHNSLKEGLIALGHEVTLVSDGDAFKQYPSDLLYAPNTLGKGIALAIRKALFRIFKYDIASWEHGIRFYRLLPQLKGYDVVQLINEAPIKTVPFFERFLLDKLFRQNGKAFMVCCGIDYIVAKYMIDRKPRYSLMDPYFNGENKTEYRYIFDYASNKHKKLHDFIYRRIEGVIASDMDYALPLQGNPKFIGLIPNPVNLSKLDYIEPVIDDKIIIFLGINKINRNQKGIPYFEKALEIVKQKYPDKAEIIIATSLPYDEYIKIYNSAHILLDQVHAYDQGYNALEAMAKGKVVFTGAEAEFMQYYNLTERVAINALPDAGIIADELSLLIENPDEIIAISKRARTFIEQQHDHIKVAKGYLAKWA